ncbi:hypothetical protein MRX96_037970 [Rhipicephalus microplus]
MLNNPFLCTLQVLASLFVSQFSEHGCALDPSPLPSSSVVDCRASTEAYQVACDRCEAEEFIMPVAVSSAPAPASGTDYHVVLPARINCLTSAIPSSGLGSSTTGKMLNNPFLCTLQVLASLLCVAIFGAWLCFGSFTASFVQRCRLQSINGGLSSGLRPV